MKVQLIKPHTHAGVAFEAGQVIEVNAIEGRWLDTLGIVQHRNDAARDKDAKGDKHNVTAFRGRDRKRGSDREENDQ